ncbi:MAG: hypothetical protein COB98_11890 [Flavobacteriaceae bacterium]|nr:MAG: hypothetical protein COB98_11890 [Flavobacteriaceae bacterium]
MNMKKTERKLEIIFTSQENHQVQIAKGKLEENGIPAYIINNNLGATYGALIYDLYKLEVNISDREKAIKLLEYLK